MIPMTRIRCGFDEPLRMSARIKKKPQMMAKTMATTIHTPAPPLFS